MFGMKAAGYFATKKEADNYFIGAADGIRAYQWQKDGTAYVGMGGQTLAEVMDLLDKAYKDAIKQFQPASDDPAAASWPPTLPTEITHDAPPARPDDGENTPIPQTPAPPPAKPEDDEDDEDEDEDDDEDDGKKKPPAPKPPTPPARGRR